MRFSRDLMNTPNPRGLNQVELGRYRALLAQNAAKIKLEGESIKASLDEIWKKASYEDKLDEALSTSTIPVKKLVILEAQFLLPSTPDFARGKMRRVAKYDLKSEFNSSKKIFSEIKNNPFSEKRIRELIEVEKQRNPTFVAFLEQRLEDIKHGGYL